MRVRAGLTEQALAGRLGVTCYAIQAWEKGQPQSSADHPSPVQSRPRKGLPLLVRWAVRILRNCEFGDARAVVAPARQERCHPGR